MDPSACTKGWNKRAIALGAQSDAGVLHFKQKPHAVFGSIRHFHAHRHFAALGELNRVRHQIEQHLAQARRIAAQHSFGVVCQRRRSP